MGEKISVLSSGAILGKKFEIELNTAHVQGMPRDVHIQSDQFRYQLNEHEFVRLALSILSARRRLVAMKELSDNA